MMTHIFLRKCQLLHLCLILFDSKSELALNKLDVYEICNWDNFESKCYFLFLICNSHLQYCTSMTLFSGMHWSNEAYYIYALEHEKRFIYILLWNRQSSIKFYSAKIHALATSSSGTIFANIFLIFKVSNNDENLICFQMFKYFCLKERSKFKTFNQNILQINSICDYNWTWKFRNVVLGLFVRLWNRKESLPWNF